LARIVVFIAAIGAVVLLIILLIKYKRAYELKKSIKLAEKKEESIDREELQSKLKGVGEDSLKLASQGLYTEAMHTLLLRSLKEFKKREGEKMIASLTSRELIPIIPLSQEEDEALRDLVFRVEISYFGKNVPVESDWLLAKESFDRLIKALQDYDKNGSSLKGTNATNGSLASGSDSLSSSYPIKGSMNTSSSPYSSLKNASNPSNPSNPSSTGGIQ
jgi:hypothetical protein